MKDVAGYATCLYRKEYIMGIHGGKRMEDKVYYYWTMEEIEKRLKKIREQFYDPIWKEDSDIYLAWIDDCLQGIRNEDITAAKILENYMNVSQARHVPEILQEFLENLLIQEVKCGNGNAANALGALYYTGRIGEEPDYERAEEYYLKAEELGDRQATENLGYIYYYGRTGEADYEKAYHRFVKGALDGHVISLYKIGDMYKNGYYVKQDLKEAFCIYDHCYVLMQNSDGLYADCIGDVHARLADCYLYGKGVDADPFAALHFSQSAEIALRFKKKTGSMFTEGTLKWALELQEKARELIDAEDGKDLLI